MQCVALRWRDLAERRRDHFLELYQSGRWKHYYTDEEFLKAMREAIMLAERWAAIAPWPEATEPAAPAAEPAWEQASVFAMPTAA